MSETSVIETLNFSNMPMNDLPLAILAFVPVVEFLTPK
jgi:hypothetical protein